MNQRSPVKLITLDVRAGLKSGVDPFEEIMLARQKLADDETLQIINTFEPIPLINKFKSMGYESWTERPAPGVIHTFFKKGSTGHSEQLPVLDPSDAAAFQAKLASFEEKVSLIDVRPLAMPEPMVTILQELETLPVDHVLFVEHKKMPQFLLPELEKRGFTIMFNELDQDQLQLLIFRQVETS